MKRISQQIREMQASPGLSCDGSFLFGWRQATEKAAQLVEQAEDVGIIERGRAVTCGYCECLIYCTPKDPSEQELADEQKAFAEHDAKCESNPLAVRLRELETQLAECDGRRREARALLHRVTKYVREDKAVTPGVTRLARLTDQVDDYLKRTNSPLDILRAGDA